MLSSLQYLAEGRYIVAGGLMKEDMLFLGSSGNAKFTGTLDAFSNIPLTTETTSSSFLPPKVFSMFMAPASCKILYPVWYCTAEVKVIDNET